MQAIPGLAHYRCSQSPPSSRATRAHTHCATAKAVCRAMSLEMEMEWPGIVVVVEQDERAPEDHWHPQTDLNDVST